MSFWNAIAASLGLARPLPVGKPGMRAYAIGDVHGCLDQLRELLTAIEADNAARPRCTSYVILLGDLIDRGPESRGVVELLRTYTPPGMQPVFIKGNHEEFLLRAMDGDPGVLHPWLEYGGRECAESYGIDPGRLVALEEEDAAVLLRECVPDAHRQFLDGFADTFRFGDYLFVHAGIRPGIPLESQVPADLRWIRQPFLSDTADHGLVIVHGHTISDCADVRPNRIGIDTGAYRGGPLTALAIEGAERRLFQTNGDGRGAAITPL
jgi:serine/threonine protein phosphatase 1